MSKLVVKLFIRKPYNDFHSIENIFSLIKSKLRTSTKIIIVLAPEYSKGIIPRIKNIINTRLQRGRINHISGDNNYLVFGLRKKNTILSIHSFDTVVGDNRVKRLIYRFFWFKLPLLRLKYVTVVSHFLKDEILKSLNCNNQFRVIPNPVNPIFVKSEKKTIDKAYPRLLQVGTFSVKNISKIASAIKNIPCHYRIIGRLKAEQIILLDKYKIDYSNTFDLSPNEMFTEYQQADILTFVSTYEGFGMPIIEANAIGRAVITGNITAMPEVAGDSAHLVNPLDVDEINRGILKLIHDDEYRNQLIQNGFKNAKRFDVNIIADQYFELYKEVGNN